MPVPDIRFSDRLECDDGTGLGRTGTRQSEEVGHAPSTEHRIPSNQNVRIVGWKVQKRRDGARRLTFKVELPDQGQTVTLSCVLIPEEVRQLTADLS
jgi:hypothetical protein